MPEAVVLRSGERYLSSTHDIVSRHTFSFGDHYDPANTAFGPLTAVNEHHVAPGAGFEPHRHSDVEIVTWVLDGALRHEDAAGNRGVVRPGEVQHLSAGSGVEHTERNASLSEPLHFLQMNLAPSGAQLRADPLPPSYLHEPVEGTRGHLLTALTLRDEVTLSVGFLDVGDALALPAASLLHLHVVRGRIELDRTGTLDAGDSVRLSDAGELRLDASRRAEVLVWQLSS